MQQHCQGLLSVPRYSGGVITGAVERVLDRLYRPIRHFRIESLKVYSCSRQTCKGYTSGLELCLRNASTLARCNQGGVLDNLLCTSGAYGPLCHSCLRDFSFSITTGGCELCRTSWLLPTLIVLTGLLLAGLIVSVKWGFLELPKFVNHARFLGIAKVSSCFCYLHM